MSSAPARRPGSRSRRFDRSEIRRLVAMYGVVAALHITPGRRLDGHLMHAITDNALMGTWPCPVPADRLGQIDGARTATSPLPPPPLPAGAIPAQRKVHASGRFMINGQFIKLGPRHAGKIVTVVIEDTHYRILHGEDELAVRPRKNLEPITRLYVKGMGTQKDRQGSPDDKPSRIS
ncbi:hypothetical protein ACIHCN_36295 [Streptomyces rishiriensis]|uniref:hypothetical protein n=1 Tax=Streptomyces rishiriensis TaxID=68264 RepID=UPI0037D57183